MNLEPLRELDKVIELVAKATPGDMRSYESTVLLGGVPSAGGFDIRGCPEAIANAAAIVAAVNFIRTHGPTISRAIAQLDDGWVLVPREPTEEMMQAARTKSIGGAKPPSDKMMKSRWIAMLAARPLPSPPAQVKP